ncbi:helix-turn-helix transcriptional regulator [Chitinasiproducens palmae]|uniref:Helix-turn-helix domain-containing protein n=1 Tax=Chitinasiproducens palmae TaxID=1770053 RepID=A0A1H2PPU5_9BURK|nr:helix-turn-helix transcriptional regulator [Chitinasiproducens palmae]SDV47980.1 Helix-turn-helix domain-containing protein [Chitinasiproducens palmae]
MSDSVFGPAALGRFLRAQRERVAPAALGIVAGARRRTPGLRREEVAQLAAVSAAWYTRIEQGHDVSVSSAALARIADALALRQAERAYLFELAQRHDPAAVALAPPADLPAGLHACVASLPSPAYVLDRDWNAVSWNAHAAHLFVGWLDGETNLLRYMFCCAAARTLVVDWDERARRLVAEFRADTGSWSDAPSTAALIDGLTRDSALFARYWRLQQVDAREGGSRAFLHPLDGPVTYEQLTWRAASRADLKLVMLVHCADGCANAAGMDGAGATV